jgi:hypothetical protein
VAADYRAVEFFGNKPEATHLRVDLSNQELARPTNLLFFLS